MVYRESLKLQSRDRAVSFHDVTEQVKEITAKSGMKNGICVVYSHHTTCSVITQECAFDMSMTGLETLQQDLVNVFEEWIPTCRYEGMYLHPGKKALDFAESVGEDNFLPQHRRAPALVHHRAECDHRDGRRRAGPRRVWTHPLHRLGSDPRAQAHRAGHADRRVI